MDDLPARDPIDRRRRQPDDPGRLATMVLGVVVIAVGVWFFAERTLGLDLPAVEWRSLWPIIVIAAGAWLLLGGGKRRR